MYRGGWAPARALGRAVAVGAVLLLAGLLLGRADLVALGVPFVVGATLGLARRTPPLLTARLDLAATVLPEGLVSPATVRVAADADLDVVAVTVSRTPYVAVVDGSPTRVIALRAGEAVEISLRVRVLRWGRRAVGPAAVAAAGCDLLLAAEPATAPALGVRALPVREPFEAEGAMPQALAHAGSHMSRRPGDGAEFAGIRPFVGGDRPRRVNWRVSLRTRELHVTTTATERSADVMVLLDSLHDAGESTGVDDRASSLDVTVRAGAGIAEHYLGRGDSVGMVDYGGRFRFLPAATGRSQLSRIDDWLLDVRVDPAGVEIAPRLLGPHVLPPRALVVALTPLLDPRTSTLLAALRHRGQSVVVVDTLPVGSLPSARRLPAQLAQRLWRLEREELIAAMADIGVPVVTWSGAGSLDAVLRDVARMAAAPRAALR